MKLELRHIDPVRAANICALVYAVIMTAFALLALPFFLLGSLFSRSLGAGEASVFAFMLFFYPVIGLVSGWISAFLGSVVYNFIIRWTGGLSLEFTGPGEAGSPGGL